MSKSKNELRQKKLMFLLSIIQFGLRYGPRIYELLEIAWSYLRNL